MELNSILFPSPNIYHDPDLYSDEIIYIPKLNIWNNSKLNINNSKKGGFSSTSFKDDIEEINMSNTSCSKSFTKDSNKNVKEKDEINRNEITFSSENILGFIPCLFLVSKKKNLLSKNFMIYFHGNAEDIFFAREIADKIRINLQVNIFLLFIYIIF